MDHQSSLQDQHCTLLLAGVDFTGFVGFPVMNNCIYSHTVLVVSALGQFEISSLGTGYSFSRRLTFLDTRTGETDNVQGCRLPRMQACESSLRAE